MRQTLARKIFKDQSHSKWVLWLHPYMDLLNSNVQSLSCNSWACGNYFRNGTWCPALKYIPSHYSGVPAPTTPLAIRRSKIFIFHSAKYRWCPSLWYLAYLPTAIQRNPWKASPTLNWHFIMCLNLQRRNKLHIYVLLLFRNVCCWVWERC